jgi:hypothetical protein
MHPRLLVLLAACSGPAATSPVVPTQPPTAPPKIAQLEQPSCPDARDVACAIRTAEYFEHKVCACKDRACATPITEEMIIWGKERSKNAPDYQPNPTDQMQLDTVVARLTDCMMKAMLTPSPPSPPSPPAPGDPPKCHADDVKCIERAVEAFSDRMCACKDVRCARVVSDAFTTRLTGMGKSSQKVDPADRQRGVDHLTRYMDCMKKLYVGDLPSGPGSGGN